MAEHELVILPVVEDEVRSAFHWYLDRNPKVAFDFEDAVEEAMKLIVERPRAWAIDHDQSGTRRYVMPRFPFKVVYRVSDDVVTVIAFSHTRRRPGYWRER